MPASPHHHTLPLISTDSPVIAQDDPVSLRDTRGELQRVMQELDGILNTAVMGIALLRHRQIDRCNSRMEELFGYGKGEMLGQSTRVWYPDENVWASVGDDVYGTLAAGREAFRELQFQRRDGSRFWGRLAGRALDPADPYAASVWIIDDLTRERAEREELSLARRVFEVNSEAIMVSDRHNRIVQVNAAFERITGFRREEVIGHDPKILGSGRHDKAFFTAMWETLTAHGHWAGELWDRHRDGREYPKWAHIDTIRDADGAISHYVTVFADISERKAAEERIRFLAQHDALTGLPNRPTLTAHLDHALARARRNGDGVAVMFIDLDNFKSINDTLGHAVGDLLLCSAAHRISDTLRHSDILARIGGDEFVVVLENISDPADVSHVGQKILDRFADALIIEGRPLHTTPSIGISLFPDDGEDIDALMKNADVAMYHAKSAGRNNFQFFAEHMNRATAVRAEMESRLRHALNHGELHLNFQPQITLANGSAHGMEALLRWRNAELGMVSPAVFIPLAEEIGLIVVIGEWVLRTACETARRWLDEGIPFGHLSVNISPHQFRQANFPDRLAAILRSTGLPGERLELEITESTLMETAEISINMLQRLKALGVALAVDDFGTGYSSLAYLKRFPIDRLKIDRAFIADLETDASDATIASAVIALAHSLGLEVVAEGVETPGQTAFLRTHGCDSVQGFLFSRPLPEEAARAFFLNPPALSADCIPID